MKLLWIIVLFCLGLCGTLVLILRENDLGLFKLPLLATIVISYFFCFKNGINFATGKSPEQDSRASRLFVNLVVALSVLGLILEIATRIIASRQQ